MEPLDLKSLEPESGDWGCVTDGRLLTQLARLGTRLEVRAQRVQDKFEALDQRVAQSQTKLDNITNEFLLLSNTQFIENRVYDEADPNVDEDYANGQIKPVIAISDEENQKIYDANVQKSLDIGLNFVSETFDHVKIDVSDSEDEDGDVPLLRQPLLEAKNPYHLRRLPYLIGSDSYLNDDFAGVGGSKPETVANQSEPDVESELSEDEIEPQTRPELPVQYLTESSKTDRQETCENPIRADSTAKTAPVQSSLFDSDSDDELFNDSSKISEIPQAIAVEPMEPPPPAPKLDFASELARKLKIPNKEEPKIDPPSLPTEPKPKKPIVNEPKSSVNEPKAVTPKTNQKKFDLFGDLGESDSDDLFSSPAVIKTPKIAAVSRKPKNLFGDSSDSGEDDFLFSSKMKPPTDQVTKLHSQGSDNSPGATTTIATTTIGTTDTTATTSTTTTTITINGVEGGKAREEDLPNALVVSSFKAHAQDGQGQQSKEKKTTKQKKGAVLKASLFSDSESDEDDFLLFAPKDSGGSLKKETNKQLFQLSDEEATQTETMSEIKPKKPIGGVAMFSPGVDILGALNKRNSAGKTPIVEVNVEDTMDGNAPSSGKKAVKTVIRKVKRKTSKINNNNIHQGSSDANESDSFEEDHEDIDDEVPPIVSFDVELPPNPLDVPTTIKKGPPVALKPALKSVTQPLNLSINSGEEDNSKTEALTPASKAGLNSQALLTSPTRNDIKSTPPLVVPKSGFKPTEEAQKSATPPTTAPKPILSAETIKEKARVLAQVSPKLEQKSSPGAPYPPNEPLKSSLDPPIVAPKPVLAIEPESQNPPEATSTIRLEPESDPLGVAEPSALKKSDPPSTIMSDEEEGSRGSKSPKEVSSNSSINRPVGAVSKSAFRSSLEKALIKGPMSPKTPTSPISPTKRFDDTVVFRNPEESNENEKSSQRVSDPPSDGEISFTGQLLVGANKIRAKGSVKRRPPTRRSRLFDALPINEGSDMEDAIDSGTAQSPIEAKADIESVDQKEVIPDKTEEQSNSPTKSEELRIGDDDNNDDTKDVVNSERPFSPDDPSQKPPPMPETVKATNHSLFDTSSDDDDDLFAQPPPLKLALPKSEGTLFGSSSSSDDDLFKK